MNNVNRFEPKIYWHMFCTIKRNLDIFVCQVTHATVEMHLTVAEAPHLRCPATRPKTELRGEKADEEKSHGLGTKQKV